MKWILGLLAVALALTSCRQFSPQAGGLRVAEMLQMFAEADGGGTREFVLPQSNVRIRVAPAPVLTGADVGQVAVSELELGRGVTFRLKPGGTEALLAVARTSVRRRIIVVVNREAVGTFLAGDVRADGSVSLFVELPDAEIPTWVSRLQSALQPAFRFPFSG